jgi:hypothetical protein
MDIKGHLAAYALIAASLDTPVVTTNGQHVSKGKQLSDKKYIKRNKKAKAQKQSRKTNRRK